MPFADWFSYTEFSYSVRRSFRFDRSDEDAAFLDAVLEGASRRCVIYPPSRPLWRAQLGCDVVDASSFLPIEPKFELMVRTPFGEKRMVPLNNAREGRVNPKGIPCLYLSDDSATAMAEMRAWIGGHISLASFCPTKELRLVNFNSTEQSLVANLDKMMRNLVTLEEQYVWYFISQAFSEPVSNEDNVADYAPTQVIAESLKRAGYDGIQYESKVGKGKTIALFDIKSASFVESKLFIVKNLSAVFAEED